VFLTAQTIQETYAGEKSSSIPEEVNTITPQKIVKEDKNIVPVYVSNSPVLWQQTKKLFEYTSNMLRQTDNSNLA
jgi:hypothetical protein